MFFFFVLKSCVALPSFVRLLATAGCTSVKRNRPDIQVEFVRSGACFYILKSFAAFYASKKCMRFLLKCIGFIVASPAPWEDHAIELESHPLMAATSEL